MFFLIIRKEKIINCLVIMNSLLKKIIGNLVVGIFVPFLLKIRWLPNVYDAIFLRSINIMIFKLVLWVSFSKKFTGIAFCWNIF